jgi:SAM-dependent methyltransferase
MNSEEYRRMFDLEDRYWWFVARRNLALRLLDERFARGSKIVDLGCGTGAVLGELEQRAWTLGLDMSQEALAFCRQRGLPNLVQADGTAIPAGSSQFGAIVALDVFEHIESDEKAFAEAFRILSPGSFLILSVPAFKTLWGPHDIALMHFRRYKRPDLSAKLARAGFQVERISYSVFFLFPIVVLIRIFEKRKTGPAKASLAKLPNWLNRLLIGIQSLEGSLIQRMNLPWGSSLIAVARKPV